MICACIFDMDGTVANTLASIAGFGNRALEACGYPTLPVEEYRNLAGNGADILMRRMLTASLGRYQEEQVAPLRAVYDRLYAQDPMRLVTEYPGMGDTLRALKAGGIRLGIISNKPDDMTCQVAERLYPGLFQAVRGQRPETPLKPAPDGALLIARQLGAAPENCLYIGDTGVDMETGCNAGMETVGVLWGFRDREELVRTGAQHVISQPQELLVLAGLQTVC